MFPLIIIFFVNFFSDSIYLYIYYNWYDIITIISDSIFLNLILIHFKS